MTTMQLVYGVIWDMWFYSHNDDSIVIITNFGLGRL